ncbi:hypothetical protein CHS0354_033303 [Potamilus streckersoni]|uniref:Uncharacterized protein n=1 Tax=Potamilus streckersoni TaxID=2493646 RepID=A0AAE0RT50_9BIVA|nr:hypothetical protein CHS0354_033303 [Potamilus streckersoni]
MAAWTLLVIILTSCLGFIFGQEVMLTCPESWTLIGTSCYSLFSSDQNRIWDSAEVVCQNQGSHLASIGDIYENNEIGHFANNRSVTEYWIGLIVSSLNNNTFWSNGNKWSQLQSFWADMQPDTSRGQCVYVQKQSMDYTYDRVYAWNVGECKVKRSFICQRMASPSGSYNCANGGYVSSKLVCDGEGDCSDLSDEISCSNVCRYLLKASSGTINSDGYPNNYTNARFCSWNIEGPLGTNIFLDFKNFQTEAGSDIVKVFVGGRTELTSVEVATLSGSVDVSKAKYLSPNNYMIIQFSTDSAFAKQGFTASYSSISDGAPLVSEITVTDLVQFLQPFTYIVSGQNFYLGNRVYIWKLTAASPRAIITIKIMTLDLKGFDTIFFYDGDSSSASMLAMLCEDCDNPGIVFSTSDKLYIMMISKTESKGSGFNFSMIQGCNIEMTDSYGMFFSPGYGMMNYANGQTCTWTIQTIPELPVLIYFEDGAEIEDGVDILQVFTNATNEVSGVAEHFPNPGFRTSELQHRKFVSSNGKVLIKFITNPIINKKGFRAFYSQDCPDPQFSNGTLVTPVATNYPPGSTHRYKDEVDVMCKTGYRFYQESFSAQAAVRLKCLYKGIFDQHQVPNCRPYYCGEPPAVKFGYIIGINGVTFQSKANYSCYPGYSFQNKSMITCQDGGWETAPICVAAKCIAQPVSIANGTGTLRQGDGTSIGTIIDYVCNAGYQIQGSSILLCGPNGNWSSALPTCVKLNCPLPRVKNGNFTVTSFPQLGDARILQCGSGYRTNVTTFICKENRTLSAVPVCQNIDECQAGTHGCRSPAGCHDTDGSYYCTCPKGYYLDTDGKTCLDIKECNVKNGYCDGVCNEQSGSYFCTCPRDGYTLFTTDGTANYTIPTSESGTLNTDTFYLSHSCVRVSCPKPPEIANGTLLTNRQFNHYGDVIEYQCKLGYIPRRATLRCDKTGQWFPSPPNCQRATCPSDSPGTIINLATYTLGPYDYGNQLTLQCNVPGRGMFNKTRQCLYNRDSDNYSLYGNQYECGVIDCGKPEQVAGSNFAVPQLTTFGSSFSFVCGNLYTRQGSSSAGDSIVRCGNDSYWDFGSLQCVGVSCSDPGYPFGGRQVATSYAQNSIVTFICDRPGFSLSRSTGIQCVLNTQSNGLVWNDTVPQCVDTENPVFTNCLKPVNFIRRYQQVRPLLPTTLQVTDNGGGMKIQTIFPQNANNTLYMTEQNLTVTYTAEDFFGNMATCQLQYTLTDEIPPEITCIAQDAVTMYMPGDTYTYNVTVGNQIRATDNRDTNVTILIPNGIFTGGSRNLNQVYMITGTAQDSAGNTDMCAFQVIVQAAPCSPLSLPTPVNGDKNCTSLGSGRYRCDLSCNPGYVFYDHQANATWSLTCTSSQPWPELIPACILDTIPPVLTCPLSKSVYLEDVNSIITIMPKESDFNFTDNSGQVTLTISTSQFNITVNNLRQTFRVFANARDENGNQVTCSYQILAEAAKCSPLSLATPLHGKKNCSTIGNGYACDLSCDAGYEFHERSELVVRSTCTTGNHWSIELPACTSNVNKQSATYTQVFEYQYKNLASNFMADLSCADIYRNGFNTMGLLQVTIFKLVSNCQSNYNPDLRINMPFDQVQLRINQGSPNGSVQFTVSVNFTVQIYTTSNEVPSWAVSACKTYVDNTVKGQNILGISTFSSNVSQCPSLEANFVTYNVSQHFNGLLCPLETVQSKIDPINCLYCPEGYRKAGDRSCEKCGLGEYQDVTNSPTCKLCPDVKTTSSLGTVSSNLCYGDCNAGLISSSGFGPCYECPRNTYYVNRTYCEPCPSGNITLQSAALGPSYCISQSNLQLRCPMGTYQTNPGICSLCPRGTYQNNEGSSSCISCSSNFSTYAVGSNSITACVAMCSGGFISVSGVSPCWQCPRNTYWINSTYCSPCPNGGITLNTGATNSQLCLSQCPAGYFSYNGYGNIVTCQTCPLHHYQPSPGRTFCIECANGQYTDGIGRTNLADCKDAATNLCTGNTCRNGGNCTIEFHDYYCVCPKGYYGRNCELEVNLCLSQPCYNGGTCRSAPSGYNCTCPTGTNGSRCEIIDNKCSQGTRCFNGGYCVNDFNQPGGYSCICLSGFGGANCSQQQSVCMNLPCQNLGQCVDVSGGLNLRHKCICQPGYTGRNCETDINECESNPCLYGATCTDLVNGYRCTCRNPLYSGTNCEIRRSPCQNVNCGSGTCVDDYYTDTYRCICNPGYYFGNACDYKIYLGKIVLDISSLPATPSNTTSCRGTCDAQPTCQGFSLKGGNCTLFYSSYTEGSLQTNSDYNTYLKSCFRPTDDYFTPWYDVDDPGADFSDMESLSVLRNVYGLTVCGGTDPVNTECRNKNTSVAYPGCSAIGVNCVGNSTNPCADYEVRFQCAVDRVFSDNTCFAKDYCEDGNPCKNGGACEDQDIGYRCNCPVGYTGLNCQTNINDCTNTSCLNGGVCIDGVNNFTCNCNNGYQGQICQTLINYCLINNRCNSTTTRNCVPVENDHICECYPGYEGQFCEINIDECASQPCYHGSTCKDGINQYICDCTAGWTGVNCNQLRQPCDPQSPCVGQAMCHNIFDDFYCECPASIYGKLCENTPNPCKDYNKCQNSATCSVPLGNMTCTCPNAGFMGDGCHVLTDLCGKTNYCQNGGTCYITQTGYGCTCPKGYVGTNCERNFDDCASSPCPLNATCIDDIGQYYCRCHLGKAGEQCSRTLDPNYDLYFYMPSKNGLATIPYPIPIGNTTGMAVSLWVRYAVPGDDGSFFAFWSGETTKSAVPVLGLNDNSLLLFQDNITTYISIPFKYNLKLNDGNWHNLVINYDSAIREYSLIVDTIKHGAQVVLQAPKLSGMWITLGCYGNPRTMNCYYKSGFRGYISQVNVYNRPLDFVSEIPQLVTKPKIVFIPGSILQWNEYSLIHGVRQVIPSTFQGSCQEPLSLSCVTRADREAPVIQNCPNDIVIYSDTRLKTVSWTEPTITGAKTTEISHRSGGTYTWGVYNVTYVAKDDNGNAAICTFKIYVQALKDGLDNPDLGTQNCLASGNFLACSISCNSSLSIVRYTPKYFSRGPSGSFNVDDKLFQKPRYPPCGKKMSSAKARIIVKLVYRIATSNCLGVKQALRDRLYGALSGAQGPNAMMNMKLCKQADCKDVTIDITCGSGSGRRKRQTVQNDTVVQLTFSESDPSTANGSLTVEEVLTNQIMGTNIFNFNDTIPNGSMDNNGFDISIVNICPQGQTEIGGICVLCGAGTYFVYYTSENISGYCENCPLGQYQNQSGQSTCLSCSVPGSTTQTTGSTSATDCHASCSAGYYFDISNKSCLPCPIGRYQDKTGQFYCEWCPVGKTTHGINSTSLSECFDTCISGQELNTDGLCVPCEIGYYRNDTDSSTCQPCQTGFITKSNGSVSLSDCNIVSCLAGSRRNVTSNMCTLCEKGTYQPDKWMTECISCGPTDRWTTDSTGSSNQSQCKFYCPSGYEKTTGTDCKICTVGTYKDNTVNIFGGCTACPFGMTSPTNGSTSVQNCSIHQCQAGYKNNANRTGCIKCPLGTYQPLFDQLDCMTCPANLSTRQEGSNSSTACETYCPSGQEKVGDVCNQCQIGYYKDNSESLFGTCQHCPDNYVTPVSNRTARALCIIRNCAAGTKRNANDTGCEDCPLNMYQPDPYQTSCISCSANTGTRQIRSTNESQCETFCASGFEKTSTGCRPCQQGYYKDNSLGLFSVCTICPMDFITPGMNATSMAQCTIGNCSAGNFINPSNNSQCLPCAKGYYQPNKWSTSCIQCDIDKTTERNASTNITDCILVCPPGKEDAGSGSCAPCQRGFYKAEYIAAKCNACPAQTTTVGKGANSSSSCSLPACVPGEYLDVAKNICSPCNYDKYQNEFWMESCVNCPTGYVTLKTGATGLSDCVLDCPSGYEYVASSKNCRICPRGSYRNRDDRKQISCSMCPPSQITAQDGAVDVSQCNIANCTMPGQYRDPASNTCKLCPIGTFVTERWRDTCDQCISGYTTQNTGSTSSSDCKYDCPSGYSVDAANICQPCQVGTYRTREATWTCQQCPNGTKTASVGSTSVNACNMSLCQPGQGYINQTCQPCPKGQYQSQAGKFDCISCPANRLYTLQTGTISISDCKSGCSVGQQFVPPSTCQNCSRGTYQDLSNEFNCKSCPADRPYTANLGASNINDCISRCNGSNDCSTNGTCTDVPISTNGYTCACQHNYADTGVPKGLLPGRECVHLCDHGYCQNNAVCEKQGESLKCICSTWYEGEFCQTRVDAQTKSEKFNDTIIGAVVGVVVGLLIIIVIIVACLVWARSRGKTKLNKTKFTNFQPEFIPIDKMSLAGSNIYEFNGQYPYTGSQRLTLDQSREVVYDNRMFAPESGQMNFY